MEEWETFIVEKKEGFRNGLIGGYWHRESKRGLTRSRASYGLGVHIWLSLVGSKLKVVTKIREAASYESNPGHLGPIVNRSYCLASWIATKGNNQASCKSDL